MPRFGERASAGAAKASSSLKVQAVAVAALVIACGAGLSARAQESAEPVGGQLPPVIVEAPPAAQPKKKAAAKKKAPPSTTAGVPEPAAPAAQPSEATAGGPLGNPNPGGVDGYLATRTSTATKTDTPLIDIPQSITVVPKALAKDQGSRDLRQALSYVPGIVMGQGEGHRDAPTIRGVSTTADFFVDGVRDDVQYFRDLYNIERIEVLKGPNAMIFGRGGGGGVINRVTKKAEGERLYEATTTYGSFDTKRVELDGGQAITNDFAFRILGMYEDSGSYRDFVDLERYGINPKVAFRPDEDTYVHLSYEYFNDDRTVDRGIPSDFLTGKPAKTDVSTYIGNPDDSYMTFESHVATATVEHEFDSGLKIRNHTQYSTYDKFYQNIFASSQLNQPAPPADGNINLTAYNSFTQRDSIFNQTDVTAKVDMSGGIRHTLVVGTEVGYQETDSQRMPNTAAGTVPFDDPTVFGQFPFPVNTGSLDHTELGLAGVYVQDHIELSRYFDIIGGIRFDHFDLDYTGVHPITGVTQARGRIDNVWSPRVGAVFKPLEPVSFYVSYSKSFLPFSGEQFSSLSATNANLAPEEFLNREIGFKWDITPRIFFTGALFMLDRQNQLVTSGPGIGTQVGKTRTEGGELALTGYMAEDWEVVAGYGYQVSEVLEGNSKGNEVPLVPHHTFSLWNKYHFLPDWAAGVGVISRTGMYAELNNNVTLPGFARLDAALFWDISEDVEAQLNVENVLDTEYYATAHNNNNITPGSPRAYYVTLTSRY